MENRLYIKNMVCARCISSVEHVLSELNIPFQEVGLGFVELEEPLDKRVNKSLINKLSALGFSIVSDRKSQLIEQMKTLVIGQIHHNPTPLKIQWPEFISGQLHLDYKYLSSLFSSVEGITFEQFIILQKIEKVKELLVYDELTVSEIAYQLDYSSVAYLSNQFKKVTGMTPSQFKKEVDYNRKFLDKI